MKNVISKLCLSGCAFILFAYGTATFSAELLAPGIHAKTGAGAGQTISRGSASLFYNPANVIYSKKIEPYVDLSFAMIKYQYYCSAIDPNSEDESSFDATGLNVNTPILTAGISYRPMPKLSMGLAFLPTGAGSTSTIERVPMNITGSGYSPVNVEQTSSGYKLAMGGAFRISHAITIGGALLRGSETMSLSATDPDSDEPFLDLSYSGAHNQFLFGARSELMGRKLVIGASYKTAVQKVYAGEILVKGTDENADYQTYEGTGYDPAVLGLGGEFRFSGFGLFLDYVREFWQAGRTLVVRGYTENDPQEKDYYDVNNIVVGAKYWPTEGHTIVAAFGNYQQNVGDGFIDENASESEGINESVDGTSFGELNAIPRMVFSGGYRLKIVKRGYFFGGIHYTKGSRTVPEGYPSEGFYSLSVLMLAGGLAYGF